MKGSSGSRTFIASRIKLARVQSGLNQKQLGKLLNLSNVTISAIERGGQKVDAVLLDKISRIFGKPVRWFYGSEIAGDIYKPPDILLTELQAKIKKFIPVYDDIGGNAEVVDSVRVIVEDIEITTLKAFRLYNLSGQPMVHDGDILVVDTAITPAHGDYILFSFDGKTKVGLYTEDEAGRFVGNLEGSFDYNDCKYVGALIQLVRVIRG